MNRKISEHQIFHELTQKEQIYYLEIEIAKEANLEVKKSLQVLLSEKEKQLRNQRLIKYIVILFLISIISFFMIFYKNIWSTKAPSDTSGHNSTTIEHVSESSVSSTSKDNDLNLVEPVSEEIFREDESVVMSATPDEVVAHYGGWSQMGKNELRILARRFNSYDEYRYFVEPNLDVATEILEGTWLSRDILFKFIV